MQITAQLKSGGYTKMNDGGPRRLAVAQTLIKSHQLKLVLRTHEKLDNNHNNNSNRMQQISTEGVKGEIWLGRQGDTLGKVQEV